MSKDYKNLDYHEFETIARILIKYIDKDKLIDGLVNKLFVKLKNSTELVEWRNATFILSLLNYRTEKIMINFVDTYNSIKEKVDDEIVKDNLKVIFNKFHKIQNISLPAKEYLDTYEKKIIKGKNVMKENKNNSQGKENKIVNNKRRRSPQNTNKDTKDNRSAKKSKLTNNLSKKSRNIMLKNNKAKSIKSKTSNNTRNNHHKKRDRKLNSEGIDLDLMGDSDIDI